MDIKNLIILDRNTEFIGEVTCEQLILEGQLRGSANVKKKIVLKKDCVMEGNVVAGNFTMEQGANFRGELLVSSSDDVFSEEPEEIVTNEESYEPKLFNVSRLKAENV